MVLGIIGAQGDANGNAASAITYRVFTSGSEGKCASPRSAMRSWLSVRRTGQGG